MSNMNSVKHNGLEFQLQEISDGHSKNLILRCDYTKITWCTHERHSI